MTEPASVPPSDDFWRDYLEKGEPHIRVGRKVFSAIPSDPRSHHHQNRIPDQRLESAENLCPQRTVDRAMIG